MAEDCSSQSGRSFQKPETTRRCVDCGLVKPLAQFRFTRQRFWQGHSYSCKKCLVLAARLWRQQNPEKLRNERLRRKYKLTLSDYERLLEGQGDVCAICGGVQKTRKNGKIPAFHVDHDHSSGLVRALLCTTCNTLLGCARDDPVILKAAVAYLERHSFE